MSASAITPAEFVEAHCFYCEKMRAKVTAETCRRRQGVTIKTLELWKRKLPEDMRANEYCASGQCKQGKKNR